MSGYNGDDEFLGSANSGLSLYGRPKCKWYRL